MKKNSTEKRRGFIRDSAKALAVAGTLGLEPILAAPAYLKKMPSTTLRLGAIGLRGIGWGNINAFKKHPEADFVAFADIDAGILKSRSEDYFKSYQGKPDLYSDYRKILERKDVDAILINTPDHWHALQLVHTLEAGKHAYVEKPLANSVEECLYLEKAVRKYGKVVQVGQQQRSGKHFQDALAWLAKGELGKIRSVRCWIFNGGKGPIPKLADEPIPEGVDYESWLGPAQQRPFNKNRFHFTFRWFWDYAGGLMTDWGVHLLDVALWGMNNPWPVSVTASGGKFAFPDDAMQTPDTLMATYQFPDFLMTWEHTIGIGRGPFDREHGIAFYGENGCLVVDRKGWEVIPEYHKDAQGLRQYKINPLPFQSASGDDRMEHAGNFLNCIKNGGTLACPIQTGSQAAIIAHLGNVAFRSGQTVGWDNLNKKIIGGPEALKFGKANYRKPFLLPPL
jgi:predicted dehydrogenase